MTEKELDFDYKGKLLFLSAPISGVAVFLKYKSLYLSLGIMLLLSILCFMALLYVYNSGDKKKYLDNPFNTIGFILVAISSVFTDERQINFVFLIGVALLAVYSELTFSLISIFSYALMISLLSSGGVEHNVISLLSAIFLLILTKYFTDFTSLLYIMLTMVSLNIVVFLVLNNLSLNNLFSKDRFIDLILILISVVFSFFLHRKINLKLFRELNEMKEEEEVSSLQSALSLAVREAIEEEQKEVQTTLKEEVFEAKEEDFEAKEEVLKANEEKNLTEKEAAEAEEIIKKSDLLSGAKDSLPTEESLPKKEEVADKDAETFEAEEPVDFSKLLTDETLLFRHIKSNPALHVASLQKAKLCGEIAEMIGADSSLAAAGAYFSDCGRMNSENYIKESLKLIKKYQLPNEILQIAKEHHFKFGNPSSKEAAIVMTLFKLDSSIQFFKSKNKRFPAPNLIDNVTDSLLMAGKLDASGLSISEYKFIKDYLMEEVPKSYDYFN